MVCCFACRSHPRIFISASFVPSLFGWNRKVYSGRREADLVMSSVILPGTSCAPSRTNSTGGILLIGSSGCRVGHADSLTEQVSSLYFSDLFVLGDQTGGSIN